MTSTDECVTALHLYLLLENSSKANNLGSILRCASAFGITTIVAIGFSKCSVQGSHGASKNIEIVAFPTGEQAEKYIRDELRCTSIIGLMGPLPNGYKRDGCPVYEDHSTNKAEFTLGGTMSNRCSVSLDFATFARNNICVGLSKDRQGLPLSVSRCCDSLVHIPHLPFSCHIPLLDTPSCLSILLSSICEANRFHEQTFQGQKFNVTRPVQNASFAVGSSEDVHAQEFIAVDTEFGSAMGNDYQGDY